MSEPEKCLERLVNRKRRRPQLICRKIGVLHEPRWSLPSSRDSRQGPDPEHKGARSMLLQHGNCLWSHWIQRNAREHESELDSRRASSTGAILSHRALQYWQTASRHVPVRNLKKNLHIDQRPWQWLWEVQRGIYKLHGSDHQNGQVFPITPLPARRHWKCLPVRRKKPEKRINRKVLHGAQSDRKINPDPKFSRCIKRPEIENRGISVGKDQGRAQRWGLRLSNKSFERY